MCISTVKNQTTLTGKLRLWKVIYSSNTIGIWNETRDFVQSFYVGRNDASAFKNDFGTVKSGHFCCFFTRKDARAYRRHRGSSTFGSFKIIKVCADSADVIACGVDRMTRLRCVGVSKMEIKSLQHQR